MTQEARPPRPAKPIPDWLSPKLFAEILALAGALVYAVTYVACARFYSPLGIEPADVGLGYADMLSQAAVYLLCTLLLTGGPLNSMLLLVTKRFDRGEREISRGT